jgi:hypothetical protein
MKNIDKIDSITLNTIITKFRQQYPDRTYSEVRALIEQIAQLDTKLALH